MAIRADKSGLDVLLEVLVLLEVEVELASSQALQVLPQEPGEVAVEVREVVQQLQRVEVGPVEFQ